MNQKEIGLFIKKLRKEKDLTQEKLAEVLGVSNRSISRWENGVNMPDLDLLMEMAKFFDISIEEVLDAERKEDIMDEKKEESLLKVAEYSNDEKIQFTKRLCYIFIAGLVALVIYMTLENRGLTDIDLYSNIASFMLGFVFSVLILGIMFTSRYIAKIRAFKVRITNRYK